MCMPGSLACTQWTHWAAKPRIFCTVRDDLKCANKTDTQARGMPNEARVMHRPRGTETNPHVPTHPHQHIHPHPYTQHHHQSQPKAHSHTQPNTQWPRPADTTQQTHTHPLAHTHTPTGGGGWVWFGSRPVPDAQAHGQHSSLCQHEWARRVAVVRSQGLPDC